MLGVALLHLLAVSVIAGKEFSNFPKGFPNGTGVLLISHCVRIQKDLGSLG